ncbi:EAL domain-containing protein [Prescottella equi]|uniref:DICT sensory domain-containing protein n=1 Tax=Rhodococcus hoagii TaxID=43767 RepID=UPI0008534FA6|nr:DICT sensory domain-containing protein [Prescottella equi]GBF13681.1 EAL domain protein [Rhodococcus sp. Br-6]MBM4476481.1 EAL domain-containing protein [Prescottella equi]NKS76841.1 EAL domain-containing protein [Prescottella equi]ORL24512.1 diguanylate phosphodiesterase [Prescottella equi]UNQ37750.1 EAL domain-containing protein [Prescottella equi]
METTAPEPASAGSAPAFHGIPLRVHRAPVRCLDTAALSAVELQLRGAEDSAFAAPGVLRATARSMGEAGLLDEFTLAAARAYAEEESAVPQLALLDVEIVVSANLAGVDDGARIIATVTEDAVMAHPARALGYIAAVRSMGLAIAVDEVGERPQSLALLSLVEPDVIITSADLVSRPAHALTARAAHAVAAYRERTDALVIARGVDSDLQRRRALGVGARFGIGSFPPATAASVAGHADFDPGPRSRPEGASDGRSTPFTIAAPGRRTTRSLKRLLVSMSKMLEMQAASAGQDTIVLGTFQHADHFTPGSRRRWAHLASQVAYTGIYGVGIQPMIDFNVHHAPLDHTDRLVDEWNVVVLGSHFCCVLAARDLHKGTVDSEREFEYVVSYDRRTVTRCAHAVLERFTD